MCGRFSLFTPTEQLQETFHISNMDDLTYTPRYNIAPSQDVFTIIQDGQIRRGGYLRWGLIPSWAKSAKIGYKMINARAETVDEKPSFKRLLAKRRCLILADGFYEWKTVDGKKQPYRIMMKNQQPFAFAGLWDRWAAENEIITTCTIITTTSNDVVQDIHERMPVVLPEEQQTIWLDPSIQDPIELKPILTPYEAEEMMAYEVSTLVNSPKNDLPELINSL